MPDKKAEPTEFQKRIIRFLDTKFNRPRIVITLSTTLVEDLHIDTSDGMNLLVMLEDEFNVSINEVEMAFVHDVDGLATMIARLVNKCR